MFGKEIIIGFWHLFDRAPLSNLQIAVQMQVFFQLCILFYSQY